MFECGYGAVEAALVHTYRIPAKAEGAFRGRLGALQKQGLFGVRNMPGKGVALRYGPDQFHRLVLACEMLEFGVAPSVVLSLVKSLWERRLRKIFRDAEDAVVRHEDAGPDDVILHIGGVHLMGDGWSDAVPKTRAVCRPAPSSQICRCGCARSTPRSAPRTWTSCAQSAPAATDARASGRRASRPNGEARHDTSAGT
jgi:hypothetical protein